MQKPRNTTSDSGSQSRMAKQSDVDIRGKLIIIVGPTGSGKTALGIELAKKYNGEIISADSRQVYRGLDIGTGKEKTFPQHLIDVANLDEDYNVSHFVRDAKRIIDEIIGRGRLPILVGGTGLWIDALVYGFELPDVKPMTELRAELEKKTWQELFKQLEKLDPHRAKHIDKHNKRRLIRALEIAISPVRPGRTPPLTDKRGLGGDSLWLGIKIPKDELQKRIEKRIDAWIAQGLEEETKKLSASLPAGRQAEKFGFMYAGKSRDEMIRLTMRYAKRQMTWFKRNKNIRWVADVGEAEKYALKFLKSLV